MEVTQPAIPDVVLIQPQVFSDSRGLFFESIQPKVIRWPDWSQGDFFQDNHSSSMKDVLRGLHYQLGQPQGKLVRVVQGAVFDVAVDILISSPFFGK